MPTISDGRWTADIDGDFVVFLIGMRINRPWLVRKWWPVFTAMPPMLRELGADPSRGCLDTRRTLHGPLSPVLIQIWRDFASLEAYAHDLTHKEAWKEFFRVVGLDGDVGIWHETFQVRAGDYECVYGNMPRFGLANAGAHRPLGSASRARGRIAGDRAAV